MTMNTPYVWICILIMFVTTYFTRMLPLVFCKGQIKNTFIKSILAYLPYAILTSMIFPEIFMDKFGLIPGILGFIIAVILSYFDLSLIIVLIFSTLATYISMLYNTQLMSIFGLS